MNIRARRKRVFEKILITFAVAIFVYAVLAIQVPVKKPRVWGVTFSYTYAKSLGLEWREVFEDILDDLGARHLRLPVYWSEISQKKGRENFDAYDFQMARAEKFGAKVILALGRKLPRWPECHEPEWARSLPEEEQQKEILKYIESVVRRYAKSQALVAWQVENEPFLPFGECLPLDVDFLDREIALVRALDPAHPIIITDSGELSLWARAMKRADIFGTTMYRTIYNKRIGQFTYPLPPSFFRVKRFLAEVVVGRKQSIVIELQAEPWGPAPVDRLTKEESARSMDPDKFRKIISYASRSGFDEFYFWGVEWWYWQMETMGEPSYWDMARKLF